jgi:outer membrane receptor protein involved in Fe transport
MDSRSIILRFVALVIFALASANVQAQIPSSDSIPANRTLTGVVVNDRSEAVAGATVTAQWQTGRRSVVTNAQGAFSLSVPAVAVRLIVTGRFIAANETRLAGDAPSQSLELKIHYEIPKTEETLVITATAADPAIDRRNDSVYKNTLFLRDDQLFETLDSGINAGQHEGGGKSIEVRRFGFNLDHGGANGGLKVLVDDIPQNQATQGHGQGYLGSLKELTPELVDDVDIINGPFSAEYGDFSALGVIHVRLKERLDNEWTVRAQGGSFGGYRTFAAWSPHLKKADSFISWEHAYTDGPFKLPLHYVRDNFSGNYTFKLGSSQSLGFKFTSGRNDFDSSGQIPLDLVYSGALDRFGYMDPSDGGNVRNGTGSAYYKNNLSQNDTLRVDGFVTRSLFDLFSNFTFYMRDPINGDGFQQHDSRLQEGASSQYVHAARLFGMPALFAAGANLTDNWINVDLFHVKDRKIIPAVPDHILANGQCEPGFSMPDGECVPGMPWTLANLHITNPAVYAQQGIDLPHLHVDAGLRFDSFRFNVSDRLIAANSGLNYANSVEPKVNIVYTPSGRIPMALHFNFGRAVTSQDARGMTRAPDAPKVAATNFYMIGTSHQLKRFSLSTDMFLIDRQHEDVYSADDGTMEYQGPSRSYGWEAKSSVQLSKHLSLNAGLTQVSNAFYLGTSPREYVDAAPHSVGNSGFTLNEWRGLSGSMRYRHVSRYLLINPDDTSVPPAPSYADSARTNAGGLDVIDFAATKKLFRGLEWNLSVDNLNNKRYYETQNYHDSRLSPTSLVEARVHGTPGYLVGFITGLTWRFE